MNLKKVRKSTEESNVDLSKCLAKTESFDGKTCEGMSVEEHCILSGYVASSLLEILNPNNDNSFIKYASLIVSLHDIGKISLPFQTMIYDALDNQEVPSFVSKDSKSIYGAPNHATIGQIFLCDYGRSEKEYRKIWEKVSNIVGAHHGDISKSSLFISTDSILGGNSYNTARINMLKRLKEKFPCELPQDINDEDIQFLTGLTVVSDWISSSRYKKDLVNNNYLDLARSSIREIGYSPLNIVKGLSFKDIFGFSPRKVQEKFYQSVKGQGTYLLEVEMGQGKTEAALYAAYLLLSQGKANGIYFALPTRLTSLSIYDRVEKFLNKITNEEESAKLVFKDSNLFLCSETGENSPGGDWFDIGKRGILAPFGIGTIDQALMAVINVRHSALRTFGLSGKVLILDELHSYDDYTGSLVCELIKQVRRLGGTVMILSATLRSATKEKIFRFPLVKNTYPQITYSRDDSYEEICVPSDSNKNIEIVHCNESLAIQEAIGAALDGCKVLWIENTVADAQNVFSVLSSRLQGTGTDIGLLHSAFLQCDRRNNEKKQLTVFGKGECRGKLGKILVGTQVLEQSLDIDADFMVTKIAPIDMLFQRMGRLWRHRENDELRKCTAPKCLIIHPSLEKATNNPKDIFGKTGAVYSPYVLYRTLKTICEKNSISIPNDIREMIELTYSDEKPENNKIELALSALNQKRIAMENEARAASRTATATRNDNEACTRYSDEKTVILYLLKKFDPVNRKIELIDGSIFELTSNPKKDERVKIGSALMMNSIQLRIKIVPKCAYIGEAIQILSKYVYVGNGDNREVGILLLKTDGGVFDVNGNSVPEIKYDDIIGYRFINNERE